ncbi:MAG: LLM class flavin-dependent oxidoreductase [Acidocella sp.]|nr:LLM class flavin-dependent oxidoreductase [Acidocella sp.]
MTKQIRFNAFSMNCVGHISSGVWRIPGDTTHRYTDLEFWIDFAKTLERGLFDGLFIADVIGLYDVYGGNGDQAYRSAAQIPVNDPLQIVPAMAAFTKHLGFGVTSSVAFEHPFPFARRMTTLDHLTKGRAGWNIVTSYLDSGARNLGAARLLDHDNRYDVADEYLDVVYKLWEGSWEDDAVIRDAVHNIYTDPSKVHEIHHEGRFFKVPGAHVSEPSPQRTPVLYQAGASSRGRDFAAKHAESSFLAAPSKKLTKEYVADLRRRAVAAGRRAEDILTFAQFTLVLGETDAEAQKKLDHYKQYVDREGALALMSGWTGVDLSKLDWDKPIDDLDGNAIQFTAKAFSSADPDKVWTVREIAEYAGIGGDGPVIVGSPATVADALQEWQAETGLDGFNLAAITHPGTFRDVVDLLVPELQRRGAYKRNYTDGALRHKLFGEGPRLPARHYGASHRNLARVKELA